MTYWILGGLVAWFATGYISACIRFGTITKLPVARLLEVENTLRREVRKAIILGPWDGIHVTYLALNNGAPLGFALPIERNYAEAFPYLKGRWLHHLNPEEETAFKKKGVDPKDMASAIHRQS